MTDLPSDLDTTVQTDGELSALDILVNLASQASCRVSMAFKFQLKS